MELQSPFRLVPVAKPPFHLKFQNVSFFIHVPLEIAKVAATVKKTAFYSSVGMTASTIALNIFL